MRRFYKTTWHPAGKALLVAVVLGIATMLSAACAAGASPSVPTISEDEMMQTLERVLEMGPQMQQQLQNIEKLHPGSSAKCAPSYPEKCIPPPPPKLECSDVGLKNFLVLPPDPHHFDPDKDGIGCEG